MNVLASTSQPRSSAVGARITAYTIPVMVIMSRASSRRTRSAGVSRFGLDASTVSTRATTMLLQIVKYEKKSMMRGSAPGDARRVAGAELAQHRLRCVGYMPVAEITNWAARPNHATTALTTNQPRPVEVRAGSVDRRCRVSSWAGR